MEIMSINVSQLMSDTEAHYQLGKNCFFLRRGFNEAIAIT
jgi:hypothetical protein